MTKFIVLLRGINVSGQKKIIMSELRETLSDAGFESVQTYIQSGNIILDAKENDASLVEEQIYILIKGKYGFEVEIFAFEPSYLTKIISLNPYLNDTVDTKKLYLTILKQAPQEENIKRLREFNTMPDRYEIRGSVIYIFYEEGAGKSKLTNNLIESKLKVKATSRNWNTTLKLAELAASS